MIGTILYVALGGALGAILRYAASGWQSESLFPWATLIINIAGSFLIGAAWASLADYPWFDTWGRSFLIIGVLGGFTTFSAFSFETLTLMQSGRPVLALAYVSAAILGCLVAVWLGYELAR